MATLRLALGQVNPTVGDLEGNLALAKAALAKAEAAGADLLVLPELALTGYPPEDLLLKAGFVAGAEAALAELAASTTSTAVAVGTVLALEGPNAALEAPSDARHAMGGKAHLVNAVALLAGGRELGVTYKQLLPNYGVFDERRWFTPGAPGAQVFELGGVRIGMTVCEDLWSPSGPAAQLAGEVALVVNVNASPFSRGRQRDREEMVAERVAQMGAAVAYVNLVGGQDELVFDGGSFVVDARGVVVGRSPRFTEAVTVLDLDLPEVRGATMPVASAAGSPPRGASTHAPEVEELDDLAEVYAALVLGTRDYLTKGGFTDAVIGLSGGIDSTIVAAIAVDALGPSHVHGVALPSRYSSEGSITDAEELAERLGIALHHVPIEPGHVALAGMLAGVLGDLPEGLTDENLQSRVRGVVLMGLSNAKGWIVLTTGNKSELATGYSTLYGDSVGGFAVIKDCPKTLVYELCRWRNEQAASRGELPPIPESVIAKPPSAELRPDQLDVDSLPAYEVLDPAIEAYVEDDLTAEEMVAAGFDPEVVARVARLVDGAEYKRRQMAPGVRITAKGFGRDRRMPITNRFRG